MVFHTVMRTALNTITVILNGALCGAHFTKTQSAIRIKALKQKKRVQALPRSLSGQLNKHNFQIIFKLHAGAQTEARDLGALCPVLIPNAAWEEALGA